ncbi:MAG: alpha-L-fucosidase [Prevotellaceae bacterium]|jgi:alpha-L-fucosidase|nr:alpha-L-fucosidase [Prevotellaceae bacterium]
MKRTLIAFFVCTAGVFCLSCRQSVTPPAPYGAIPSADQVKWQQLEYYMFAHFGPNTFTNVEWGDGKEDPKVFNPTALDCRQWAETAKKAGMKGIIITAKHHDGFCLWPSRYSTHTVRESAWKDGHGDVLKELSEACREAGLGFGVYLSPWDRNHPTYGKPVYDQTFTGMLSEVLSHYGEVFEQWFDGANGEGENGKKGFYTWPLYNRIVYGHQPHAIIFSDVGPGCRWIGNENGRAGETCWSRLDINGFEPGKAPATDTLNSGNIFGQAWVPGEADVSIRPGWFYSAATDDKVKSLDQLLDIYYSSVGRNSNLLLNVPPDRTGRIHPNDSIRLMELRAKLDTIFSVNLLHGAKVTASSVRGNDAAFDAANVLDTAFNTYWATDDLIYSASLEFELPQKQTFNLLLLQEYIPLGQRVAEFNVEYWDDTTDSWQLLASATTIGYKRILRLPATTAEKLRVNILHALACPVLNTVELYCE